MHNNNYYHAFIHACGAVIQVYEEHSYYKLPIVITSISVTFVMSNNVMHIIYNYMYKSGL